MRDKPEWPYDELSLITGPLGQKTMIAKGREPLADPHFLYDPSACTLATSTVGDANGAMGSFGRAGLSYEDLARVAEELHAKFGKPPVQPSLLFGSPPIVDLPIPRDKPDLLGSLWFNPLPVRRPSDVVVIEGSWLDPVPFIEHPSGLHHLVAKVEVRIYRKMSRISQTARLPGKTATALAMFMYQGVQYQKTYCGRLESEWRKLVKAGTPLDRLRPAKAKQAKKLSRYLLRVL